MAPEKATWGGRRPGAGRPKLASKTPREPSVTVRLPNPDRLNAASARLGLSRTKTADLALQALSASQQGCWKRIRAATSDGTLYGAATAVGEWLHLPPSKRQAWSLRQNRDLDYALTKQLHPADALLLQLWVQRWASAPDKDTAAAIWNELALAGPGYVPPGAVPPDGPRPPPSWPPYWATAR